MSNIKDSIKEINTVIDDLENPKNNHLSSEEIKKNLDEVNLRRENFVFQEKSEKDFIDIKHQIENLFGVNFCSSEKFLGFIEWLKNNKRGVNNE